MAKVTYEKEITALLVIDPYNDFIAEGGKLWDRVKGVAEANACVAHMVQVLHAARQAELRVFYALHRHYRPGDYETWKYIAAYAEGRLVGKDLRTRHVGWRDPPRIRASARRYRGPRALGLQRLCQHGFGFAAQNAWHPSAHRHRAYRTYVRGGNCSLCG